MSAQVPADSLECAGEDNSDSSDTISSTEDSEDTIDPPSSPSSSPEREPGGRENCESENSDFVSLLPFYLSSELPVSAANNKWTLRLKKRYKIQDIRSRIEPRQQPYIDWYETITTHGLGFPRIPWDTVRR